MSGRLFSRLLATTTLFAILPAGADAQRRAVRSPVAAAPPTVDRITCNGQTCPNPLRLDWGESVSISVYGDNLASVTGARLDRPQELGRIEADVGQERTRGLPIRLTARTGPANAGPTPLEGLLELTAGSGPAVGTDLRIQLPGQQRMQVTPLFIDPVNSVLRTARIRFGSCGPLSSEWKIRVEIPVASYSDERDIARVPDSRDDPCVEERDARGNWTMTEVVDRGVGLHFLEIEALFDSVNLRLSRGFTYSYDQTRFRVLLPFEAADGEVRFGQPQSEWQALMGRWNRRPSNVSGPTPWMRDRMDDIARALRDAIATPQVRDKLSAAVRQAMAGRDVDVLLAISRHDSDEWNLRFHR